MPRPSRKARLSAKPYARLAYGTLLLLLIVGSTLLIRSVQAKDRCHEAYSLLNPLRRCTDILETKREYETFSDQLATTIASNKALKDIDIALYFRDLDGGPWFGINEDEEFYPASLTKLPTMITLLKLAEMKPDILEQRIGLEKLPDIVASVPPEDFEKTIVVGEAYAVREVLRKSIIYSDNYSDFLLQIYVGNLVGSTDYLVRTFEALGITEGDQKELTLTVKGYASIFRALYNSQYLGKEMSQKALDLLRQSHYRSGLRGYLPPEVPVAHKFGYFNGGKKYASQIQLHDCGIVYHPGAPYILCIMTKGKDVSRMTAVIAELSKIVFDEVTTRSQVHAEP